MGKDQIEGSNLESVCTAIGLVLGAILKHRPSLDTIEEVIEDIEPKGLDHAMVYEAIQFINGGINEYALKHLD